MWRYVNELNKITITTLDKWIYACTWNDLWLIKYYRLFRCPAQVHDRVALLPTHWIQFQALHRKMHHLLRLRQLLWLMIPIRGKFITFVLMSDTLSVSPTYLLQCRLVWIVYSAAVPSFVSIFHRTSNEGKATVRRTPSSPQTVLSSVPTSAPAAPVLVQEIFRRTGHWSRGDVANDSGTVILVLPI